MDPQLQKLHNVIPRSTYMSLINEALARAHCSERLAAAESERLVREVMRAKRAERKAGRAAWHVAPRHFVRRAFAVRS
jgi:hypothetical protein